MCAYYMSMYLNSGTDKSDEELSVHRDSFFEQLEMLSLNDTRLIFSEAALVRQSRAEPGRNEQYSRGTQGFDTRFL